MDLPKTTEGTNSPKLTGNVPQSAPESSLSTYNDEILDNAVETNKDNDSEKHKINENDLDAAFYDLEEQEIYKINEMDEYFDIPYISKNQNEKNQGKLYHWRLV